MDDMNDIPAVSLPGSETWEYAWDWGNELNERFPGQGGSAFAGACAYNDVGPTATARIEKLFMLREGYNDGHNWIWLVELSDGSTWTLTGGCDYTGWDCQSHAVWKRDEESTPATTGPEGEAVRGVLRDLLNALQAGEVDAALAEACAKYRVTR